MTQTDAALSHLAESLASAVSSGEPSRLRDYLSGRKLPAVGGDLERADILLRAIPLIQEPADFPRRLAQALAPLVLEEIKALQASGSTLGPQRRALLLNALYLAAELPAEESFFAALKKLLEYLQAAEQEELRVPLWRALVYQQTDASLNQAWLSILESSGSEALTPARKTLLLIAWRGLLWIPPSAEMRQAGRVVDFDRISLGLEALYSGLSVHYGPDLESQEARLFLNTCLDILAETFPRSAEFWADRFLPYLQTWPRELAVLVLLKWSHPARTSEVGVQNLEELREQATRILERTVADLSTVEANMERRAEDLIKALNEELEARRREFSTSEAEQLAMLHALKSISYQMAKYNHLIRFWEDMDQHSRAFRLNVLWFEDEEVEDLRRRQSEIEALIRLVRKAG